VLAPTTGFITLEEEVRSLRQQVQDSESLIRTQEQKIAWLTKVVYGPRSERRPVEQDHGDAKQASFLTAPVEAVAVVVPLAAAPAETVAESPQADEKAVRNAKKGRGPDGKKKARNGGGRRPVNRSLRPVEVLIPAPDSERVAADGTQLVLLGYEISEREAYISAELVPDHQARRWARLTREVPMLVPHRDRTQGKHADRR
jgi:hypothetical protein